MCTSREAPSDNCGNAVNADVMKIATKASVTQLTVLQLFFRLYLLRPPFMLGDGIYKCMQS